MGYVSKVPKKNRIGVTGFLERYASVEELGASCADNVPQAVGTSFEFISVNGEWEPKLSTQPGSLIKISNHRRA